MCLAEGQFCLLTKASVIWRTCTALSTEHIRHYSVSWFSSAFFKPTLLSSLLIERSACQHSVWILLRPVCLLALIHAFPSICPSRLSTTALFLYFSHLLTHVAFFFYFFFSFVKAETFDVAFCSFRWAKCRTMVGCFVVWMISCLIGWCVIQFVA